jgi:RNA polymerase sigma-70 factor (ECF subfamily)
MDSRAPLIEAGSCSWVTAVLDVNLFERPDQAAESREQVGIAFIALLQRLPPKQRAALLLKDVLGWDAEDIAATLDVSVAGVNSALHRARETMARVPLRRADEPNVELVRAYVKSWENRDLDGLVALLKRDVVLAMPPFASWVTGAEAVRDFFQRPDFIAFWSRGVSGKIVRANGGPAIAWYVPGTGNRYRPHALELQRWEGGLLAESIHFVGGAT